MAAGKRLGDVRVENMWVAAFSAAISGFVPDLSVQKKKSSDARDAQYVEDAVNYAENVADNAVVVFVERFGGAIPTVITENLDGDEEEEEEEEEEEDDDEDEEDEEPRRRR